MKKSIARVLLLLLGLGIAYFVFGSIKDATASSESEAICKDIRNGMTDSQVKNITTQHGGWFRSHDEREIVVGTNGWSLICRCRVQMNSGLAGNVSKSLCIN
jgi:hypothetical protein